MLALSIGSAVSGVVAQQNAASAQEAYNQRQYANTMRARAANMNQVNLEQQQERENAMQKLEQNDLNARAALSTGRVAAGESGVSGLSVDALLADLGNKSNRYSTSVKTNYDRTSQALNNQRENIDINAASSINQLKTPQAPDYIGAALRIGTAAYDYDQKFNNKKWFG